MFGTPNGRHGTKASEMAPQRRTSRANTSALAPASRAYIARSAGSSELLSHAAAPTRWSLGAPPVESMPVRLVSWASASPVSFASCCAGSMAAAWPRLLRPGSRRHVHQYRRDRGAGDLHGRGAVEDSRL